MQKIFTSSSQTKGYPSYAEKTGQVVTVLNPLPPDEYDIDEVGSMFRIRFVDGAETDAFACELSRYENYSGRGMYGKTCFGIICDDTGECIEEAAENGLRGACTDSMGRRYIVYWPSVT